MRPITKQQKKVLDFIKSFIKRNSFPPTLEEIASGLKLSAVSTVHQHVNALIHKGHLQKRENFARAIEIKKEAKISDFIEIPLLGLIAAGAPIATVERPELIKVPREFVVGTKKHHALRVQGHSMQDAEIFNGDIVVICEQTNIEDGGIGVALVNGKATLKKIYWEKTRYRLQPANTEYQPIYVKNKDLEIRGRLTGIVRSRFELVTKEGNLLPLTRTANTFDQRLQINNRRFIGNKSKLLGFISDIVAEKCGSYQSFCDIFAGTGAVANHFSRPGVKVIANDLLGSSYNSLKCWLETTTYDTERITGLISHLNNLKTSGQNYISKNFGGTYFTPANAKKIGAIREEIETLQVTPQEKAILLTSLIYAMDKVANTVGHYEAYRKTLDTTQEIKLLVPDINVQNNQNNKVYNKDANKLVREIECDVLYIDPPYNSRQYGDSYHLLENVVTWKKPKVLGVAKKMEERGHLKSKYCLKSAPEAFRDLILNAKTKHILLSYNNTAESKNTRSNATISDKWILETLKMRGKVDTFERDYKGFTTGKSDASGNSERVFYCRVTN